ncbi:MAG: 2-oxoacid:acceptor oxidoreductase subunit alpha, partial [Candidatus Marinimicrobia bacterium]|nr:2-oxoacid:acceptor oxidoreductase subunit alpha [Candidatus Neomarinimicrobiota bacterium]
VKELHLDGNNVIYAPISSLTKETLKDTGMDNKSILRSKNMFALGLCYFIFDRPLNFTEDYFDKKFAKVPAIIEANKMVLKAGYNYGSNIQALPSYKINPAKQENGLYRSISGNQATAWGLLAAAEKANLKLFCGSYPITPASEILHEISKYKHFGAKAFQAEDEIAGIASAIGASYAGDLACTTTSGPGMALKTEAIGLAIITELPLVIVNVQRGGPSTGMPTKMEQSDLLQAVHGRNSDAQIPVITAQDPADCFDCAFEAARVALKYMTPVILLTDGYLGQGSGPWLIPDPKSLPEIKVTHPDSSARGENGFMPYSRDENEARPWALPGTPGLEHRIGGLEKENITGMVSQDPENHQLMTDIRARKITRITQEIPPSEIFGKAKGKVLVIGWGSTHGSIHVAVDRVQAEGKSVSQLHLRWVSPFPSDLKEICDNFDEILIPEVNSGQLSLLLKADLVRPIHQLNKVRGEPFRASEIEEKINEILG